MNFFQTILVILTTPNKGLSNLLYIPFSFVDVYINMLLFTTILNIKTSKKQKLIYFIVMSIIASLSRIFVPNPYGTFINMVILILLVKFVLKATLVKAFLAEFISTIITAILELIVLNIYSNLFDISYPNLMTIPIYKYLAMSFIYLLIYFIYKAIKYLKFNINLDAMTKKSKFLFILTAIFGILVISLQLYLINFYHNQFSLIIAIISIIILAGYFFISIYCILNAGKLATTVRDLQTEQLHNKTLTIMHDNIRTFKHDFNNTIQCIGGYIDKNDMNGLKKYYTDLLLECKISNNLTALNPDVINNPAIYNVLATKYHRSYDLQIVMNVEVFLNLYEIEKNMKLYEFTRIFAILLDNAIEAAKQCEKKEINVSFRKEIKKSRLLVTIENTYNNKDVNLEKIFERDYTSKKDNTDHGLGLFEVRRILNKSNNLNLFTNKNQNYFKQELEIYY